MEKTAIITGGSRGIGFACAHRLGLDGFNVVLFATRSEESCAENINILKMDKINYLYVQGDITSGDDRNKLVEAAVEKFGGIHVLVNNAGVAPKERNDLLDMTEESFDWVVGINTKSTLLLTQLVAKQMLKQKVEGRKRGTIIFISSCSSVVSSINRGEYCISKAGVSMLTTLFADRLANDGILVHEVRPGVISTDMTKVVTEKYDQLIASGMFPIPRWGEPEDVAGVVSAFADDHFLYTTGNYVDVDGGFHIQKL